MNNDLISRESLKKAIEQEHQRCLAFNPICSSISLHMLNKIIDNAPTNIKHEDIYMPNDNYKIPRIIEDNGEVYVNLDDVIENIKDHGDRVETGRESDIIYKLAHAHIIELLKLFKNIISE